MSLLTDKGHAPEIIEYLKTPPTILELKHILKLLGVPAHAIVRRKDAAAAAIVPDDLTEDKLIAAMIAHPTIIERPIVVSGEKAALGRPPERVLDIL